MLPGRAPLARARVAVGLLLSWFSFTGPATRCQRQSSTMDDWKCYDNRGEVKSMSQGRKGAGRGGGRGPGRLGGRKAAGPDGYCVCPGCGHKVKHVTGQPCYERACPKCGFQMTRA
jgi:hypothetical protein